MTKNFIETPQGLIVTCADGKERLIANDFATSNYHWRDLINGYELTDKERQNFDYYDDEEIMCQNFFRYKGELYDLGDFMRVPSGSYLAYYGWQGSSATSAFSAMLIKLSNDGERVMVALQRHWQRYYLLG